MSNRVVHFEIHAADPDRAAKFYTAVFGWTISRYGEMDYWSIETGKESPGISGGLTLRRGPDPAEGQPVNTYVCVVQVDNYDNYAQKIADNGGINVVPKAVMPGIGTFGYFKDTEGNIFGIIQ